MRETNHFVSAGRTLGLALLTAAVVAACGGGSGTSSTPAQQAAAARPAGLVYPERSVIATFGDPVWLAPRSSGGAIALYRVDPELPLGVILDPSTGIISGRAFEVSNSTLYTITGSNRAGSTQTSVRIEVKTNAIKPSGLSYPNGDSMTFVAGEAKSVLPKTEGGKITQYSISQPLPEGLHFNTQTGEISGTPSKLFAVSGYTVEGRNGAGSIKTRLEIQVVSKAAKPTEPKYTNSTIIATVGQPVQMNAPSTGGIGRISYSIDPPLPNELSFNSDLGIITGTPSVIQGTTSYSVTARNSAGRATTILHLKVNPVPEWAAFNAMNTARAKHTATLLPDNHVLVAGGVGTGGVALNSVEMYEAGTAKWLHRTHMNLARSGATAILLGQGAKKGQVLVVGGFDGRSDLSSAEIYDPAADKWTSSTMIQARGKPVVTLLPDGKVLVAGGDVHGQPSESTELYDPDANTWTQAPPMRTPRASHVATVLKNGKVLVMGGRTAGGKLTNTAELYDPKTKQWSPVRDMAEVNEADFELRPRTATLLGNGKVLVVITAKPGRMFAELYDPDTNQWSVEQIPHLGVNPNFGYTATLLHNGQVLLAGGHRGLEKDISMKRSLSRAILFDPNDPKSSLHQRWHQISPIPGAGRGDHTATLLSDGTVLLLGGKLSVGHNETYLPSAELFTSWKYPM